MKKYITVLVGVICAFFLMPITAQAKEEFIDDQTLFFYAVEIGSKYDIDPFLLIAICEEESSKNIYAQNKSNPSCKGLMQVSQKWHSDRMEELGVDDLYDPYGNMLVAADFLSDLYEEKDDTYYVLMRYNMKISTANSLYKQGIISDYALEIAERAEELRKECEETACKIHEERTKELKEKGYVAGGVELWM